MMNLSILHWSIASAALAGSAALVHADLDIHPENFGGYVDMGQVTHSNKNLPDNQAITRSAAWLANSATWDEKLDINLAVGGIFWYALPEKNFRDRLLLSGFGLGQAEGVYAFGDPKNPTAKLHMGLFDYKYNPDARNLGEYLFRCGAYPTYMWTGGWSYLNSASYQAQGFLFSLPTLGGMITHDFGLYMERNISPTHDLSPAYLVKVKPGSAFEFGAGLVWQNGLSFRGDSVLAPRTRVNAYYKSGPYANLPLTQDDIGKPGYNPGDPHLVPNGDPRVGQDIPDLPGEKYVDSAGNGTPNGQLGFYTFKAFKAMARASMDIGSLMGMKPNDFKAYAEWAWLGIQNQPFYYDKPAERMPILFGLNIPTFGLLDVFNVELDYRKGAFRNDISQAWYQRWPIPVRGDNESPYVYREEGRPLGVQKILADNPSLSPASADSAFSAQLSAKEKTASETALHWSIYAKRKITPGVSVTAQVASDYLRQFDIVFATPNKTPATERTKDWYYVLRVEFGI